MQEFSSEADISQLASSTVKVEPSACLTDTVKPVMGDPPLSGDIQLTVTTSGYCDQDVVGAAGCAGI